MRVYKFLLTRSGKDVFTVTDDDRYIVDIIAKNKLSALIKVFLKYGKHISSIRWIWNKK